MIAQLKGESTQAAFLRKSGEVYPVHTAWCESVELLAADPNAKTRSARVWVKTHGQSNVWDRVFILVRVDSSLSNSMAVCSAANKAHNTGKGYSWVMWARGQIKEKYPRLLGDEVFKAELRRITSEWMPRVSDEGRAHITKVLKLPSFTAMAFENVPKKEVV